MIHPSDHHQEIASALPAQPCLQAVISPCLPGIEVLPQSLLKRGIKVHLAKDPPSAMLAMGGTSCLKPKMLVLCCDAPDQLHERQLALVQAVRRFYPQVIFLTYCNDQIGSGKLSALKMANPTPDTPEAPATPEVAPEVPATPEKVSLEIDQEIAQESVSRATDHPLALVTEDERAMLLDDIASDSEVWENTTEELR